MARQVCRRRGKPPNPLPFYFASESFPSSNCGGLPSLFVRTHFPFSAIQPFLFIRAQRRSQRLLPNPTYWRMASEMEERKDQGRKRERRTLERVRALARLLLPPFYSHKHPFGDVGCRGEGHLPSSNHFHPRSCRLLPSLCLPFLFRPIPPMIFLLTLPPPPSSSHGRLCRRCSSPFAFPSPYFARPHYFSPAAAGDVLSHPNPRQSSPNSQQQSFLAAPPAFTAVVLLLPPSQPNQLLLLYNSPEQSQRGHHFPFQPSLPPQFHIKFSPSPFSRPLISNRT